MNFTELNIHSDIVKALSELGITEPTSIQQKSIPPIREGKDVIGISNTGSGKTAAFGVPLLEKISPGQGIQLLVMAPTRELAVQISQELQKFGRYLGLHYATIYGGVGLAPQEEQLQRAEVVVGTPGRLRDHLDRRNLDLSGLRAAVLDEADKMVDMGFIEDITYILDYTPQNRQFLLFGATISTEIDRLKERYMHEPLQVEAEALVKEEFLKQYYYNVPQQQKFSLLAHLLKKEDADRVMIFASTRYTVEILHRNLRNQGFRADMIHGKMSQSRRLRVMEMFNQDKFPVLVASAVAARGLHIDGVSHIFNYDLSQDPEEYVHRVGRTARAGNFGKAITLLEQRDFDTFRQILNRFPLNVEELPLESFPRVPFDAGRRGQRFGGGFSRGREFNGSGRFGRQRSGRDAGNPRENRHDSREHGRIGRDRQGRGFRGGSERSSYIPNGSRLSNPARAPAWAR